MLETFQENWSLLCHIQCVTQTHYSDYTPPRHKLESPQPVSDEPDKTKHNIWIRRCPVKGLQCFVSTGQRFILLTGPLHVFFPVWDPKIRRQKNVWTKCQWYHTRYCFGLWVFVAFNVCVLFSGKSLGLVGPWGFVWGLKFWVGL